MVGREVGGGADEMGCGEMAKRDGERKYQCRLTSGYVPVMLHAQAMVARNEVALHDCFNLSWGEEEEEEGGGGRRKEEG